MRANRAEQKEPDSDSDVAERSIDKVTDQDSGNQKARYKD